MNSVPGSGAHPAESEHYQRCGTVICFSVINNFLRVVHFSAINFRSKAAILEIRKLGIVLAGQVAIRALLLL